MQFALGMGYTSSVARGGHWFRRPPAAKTTEWKNPGEEQKVILQAAHRRSPGMSFDYWMNVKTACRQQPSHRMTRVDEDAR